VGRGVALVGDLRLLRVDDPRTVHAEIGGTDVLVAQAGLDLGDLLRRVALAPQRQIDVIDGVQAGGLGRNHHRLFGVEEVDVLLLHHFTDAEGGGEVGDAEDQAGHAVRGGGDVIRLDQGLRNLNQRLDLHMRLPPGLLLQVVEQAGDVFDVIRPVHFGENDAVKFIGRAEHDRLQVAQEKLRADVVRPYGDDLFAEIQAGERFDHALPALRPFELIGAGVLEVHHHVVDRRLYRVGRVLV